MSRYVDLDGLTWDGNPIATKIQEVKTRYGYMQGITIGWLWGDNVPHIDLEEHDKQIKSIALDELVEILTNDWAIDIMAQSNKEKLKRFIISNGMQLKDYNNDRI